MPVKIVISKPTFDATDLSLADKNKIFDSQLNHLKTFSSGAITRSIASGPPLAVSTVTHGLGYKPLVLAYFRDTTNQPTRWYVPMTFIDVTTTRQVTQVQMEVCVTTTQVLFKMYQNFMGSVNVEIQYEIFYEGA